MKVLDADKLRVNFGKLRRHYKEETTKALRQNGQDVIRAAKILAPVGETGETRRAIHGEMVPDGYKMDFGPKSIALEGGRKAGTAKSGQKIGAAAAQPFVNPAMRATEKRRAARLRRAANKAVKMAMNGNG